MSNFEIENYAAQLAIPYFRGVFSRDKLPSSGPQINESAVINLDDYKGPGTHWVCYIKRANRVQYYDSFGVQPPAEFIRYLGPGVHITYNYEQDQEVVEVICGHLCLLFLTKHKSNMG